MSKNDESKENQKGREIQTRKGKRGLDQEDKEGSQSTKGDQKVPE